MSSEKLLDPQFVAPAIIACDLAGLSEEAELARQTARVELKRVIFESWLHPNDYTIGRTLRLAHVLAESDCLPGAWIDSMNRTVQEPLTRLGLQLEAARLQKNWEQVRVLATEGVKAFPTFYFLSRFQGEALYHLGRGQEALIPLEKYTSFAKDEIEFPMAMDLIEAIKQKEKAGSPQ